MEQAGAEGSFVEQARELFTAVSGVGPLLERDYWAIIRDCRLSPRDVASNVSCYFEAFAPKSLVVFKRRERECGAPLRIGDELDVHIKGAGHFGVRVIHTNAQSLTVATLKGHPEAGRITFGAYRNGRGDVVFHIRSRARSSSRSRYYGFVSAGEAMQTRCWTDYVNRVAEAYGRGVVGWIYAETRICEDEPDTSVTTEPTYLARGDE